MSDSQKMGKGRVNRRAALRSGAAVGVVGAGLAVGADNSLFGVSSASAQQSAWRKEHLEVDFAPADPVSIVQAGSGPPQRGDWFYIDASIYAAGNAGGARIGVYQCMGAWTHDSSDSSAADHRMTVVQYKFADGAIAGLINERDPEPKEGVEGVITGGTGRFVGAAGTFRQLDISENPPVARGVFELLLPNLGM